MIDTWHPLLQLLVLALACSRAARLIAADTIFETPRERLRGWLHLHGQRHLPDGMSCIRCVGVWVAVVATLLWALWPEPTLALALPLAIAQAALKLDHVEVEAEDS